MKILITIPARFKSSRFPGKPLKKILGKEMIMWVLDSCKKLINKQISVVVATDDKKIFNFVQNRNFKAIMTSKSCLTGTDRVAEVAKKIYANIYVNVQGDEPLINRHDIIKIIRAKINFPKKIICGFSKLRNKEDPRNRNIPKVLINKKKELIYISRAPIPASKDNKINKRNFLKQVCVYAFNRKELNDYHSKRKSNIEKIVDIEIIRFLEMDYKVKMVNLNSKNFAVDTIKDLKNLEKFIKKNK